MILWIVDDDEDHLRILKLTVLSHHSLKGHSLKVVTFSSLKSFHLTIEKALQLKISPPDLIIADYNFQAEGNWISYIKKYFDKGIFPYRYMIFSQIITPEETLDLRSNDPNSLYVKIKKLDNNFQNFLSFENVQADIIGDLLSSVANPGTVRNKYFIPEDLSRGKTNKMLNIIIQFPGMNKKSICQIIRLSPDSFNKIKTRINKHLKKYKISISMPEEKTGYHLVEIDRETFP